MRRQSGMTLIEVVAVLAIAGLALGAASLYLRPVEAPLHSGAAIVEGALRAARLKAMASTSAYRVSPDGASGLRAESATSCSAATWSDDPALTFELPEGVTLSSTAWSVCFGSRGIADANTTIALEHPEFGSISVEVLLGGATRVTR